MGYQIRLLMLLGTLICLASVVLSKQGTSVYYAQPYLPSACYGNQNQGIMIAGANPTLYDDGNVCGRMYKVRCLGGTNNAPRPCKMGEITVRMVDLCNGCGENEINLSQHAFSRIANLKAGRVRIDYVQV